MRASLMRWLTMSLHPSPSLMRWLMLRWAARLGPLRAQTGHESDSSCASCARLRKGVRHVAEVEFTEEQGKLYFFKYPVAGSDGDFLPVATTRPETILGDTAVAVNPNDEVTEEGRRCCGGNHGNGCENPYSTCSCV